MFEGLKKRLSEAVKAFTRSEEKKIAEEPQPQVRETKIEVRPAPEAAPERKKEESARQEPHKEEKKDEPLVKLSLKTKIKSVFSGTVKLSDSDIDRFLSTVETSMLESDVSYSATEDFLGRLRAQLKESEISSRGIEGEVTGMIRSSLLSLLEETRPMDVAHHVKERLSRNERPVKILFLGPNGTGKTTTIAKLAYMFKGMGLSCVLSASDTFRAAAIEQLAIHAERLGVPVIKSKYGADPASVAFDAIAYARAHGADIVLIDSAGRQETNKNLIEEMKKMARISKPDITIFVGESTAGNVIAEQIGEFGKFMNIDGIILTKLDADAKGGGAISIAHTTGKPVLYFGTGQEYGNLVPFTPDFVADAVMP